MNEFNKSYQSDFNFINNERNERIVYGWCSVEDIDKQGDFVSANELRKAMIKYMIRGGTISVEHQNKPVGKVIDWGVKKHPELGVDAMYIGVNVYDNYKIDDFVWEGLRTGIFKGFSISGSAEKRPMEMNGKNVTALYNIELTEISFVNDPANQHAVVKAMSFAKSADAEPKTKAVALIADGNVAELFAKAFGLTHIEKNDMHFLIKSDGGEIKLDEKKQTLSEDESVTDVKENDEIESVRDAQNQALYKFASTRNSIRDKLSNINNMIKSNENITE